MAIAVHAVERLIERIDGTLSREDAEALLWQEAAQMPDATVYRRTDLCGKPCGLVAVDGTVVTVEE